jgi:hypothetical protein
MLPSCITELFDDCPMTGDCANQALPGASGTLTCFASGVRVEMETPMCASAPRVERRVYRSDGMLCYKVTTQYGQACETGTETWTDGAGVTVATRGLPYMQSPSTFVCADGERSTCSGSGPSCRWSDWTTPTCEDGVCPMAREN